MATKKKIKFDPTKDRVVTFNRAGEKLSEINGVLKSDFYGGVERRCYLSDEYCAFYKRKKQGIVDSKGEIITPAEWESIRCTGKAFKASKTNKVTKYTDDYYINTKGEELFNPEEYKSGHDVYDGRIVVTSRDTGKMGAFDLEGNMVVAPKYLFLNDFDNNVAKASEEEGRVGLIDLFGNWALRPEYSSVRSFGRDLKGRMLKYSVINKDGKCGLINQDLKIVVEPKYDGISDFDDTEGLILVVRVGEKQGVVDVYGNWLIPAEYDHIYVLKNHFIKLEKQNKFGIADMKGNLLVDGVEGDFDFEHGLLRIGDWWKEIEIKRTDGTTIFKGKDVIIFPDILLVSYDGKKWGVINHNGEELVPQEYFIRIQKEQVKFSDGLFNLTKDDKTIYINEKGEIKISIDTCGWAFKDGYAIIGTEDNYSLINLSGEVIVSGIAKIRHLGGGYFYLNNAKETEPKILNVNNGETMGIPGRVLEDPNNGYIKIQAPDSKYGVVSIVDGNVILEPIYEEVLLTANGIWGYIPKAE